MHTFLAGRLNAPAAAPAQEEADSKAADTFYARGGTWLRENTRDTKKFRVLFNENISYGFHRNLLGLRLPGLILNASILIICVATLAHRYPIHLSNSFNDALLPPIAPSVLH